MSSVASAPLKLILFGEHSAVYGYPALGIPLPWRISVSIDQSDTFLWDVEKTFINQLNSLTPGIFQVFPELNNQFLKIAVSADAPIGMGFGSSAAFSVALARAIFQLLNMSQDNNSIWHRAHQLETHFHKRPSGIDTGLAAWEMSGSFFPNHGSLPFFKPLADFSAPLIVGALPRFKSTGELISELRIRLEKNPGLKSSLAELGKLSEMARSCLDDPFQFGIFANHAHRHLSTLGLSTPELDRLLESAIKAGAIGGKLSGAGGGGAFYIVCPTYEKAVEIANSFAAKTAYAKQPTVLGSQ